LGLNNWITLGHQYFFLVSNFFNLTILAGKKIEKNNANSMKNVKNKKIAKKFEITNFKKKRGDS
jgi:hypothetical protein